MITRRLLIGSALGALAVQRLWASSRIDLGGWSVQTLSDGELVLPVSNAVGDMAVLTDEMSELMQLDGGFYHNPLNITLAQRGDDLVLFDCGSGPDFVPTAGLLLDALTAAGFSPDDITHVIFTHAHPDHFWGILDDFDEPLFPNARLLMGRIERDFWTAPETLESLPEDRKSFAVGAARRIEALGDKLEVFEDGDEVIAGVTAMLTPGHTPGHISFDLGDIIVAGDVANSLLAFAMPDMHAALDQDPELAAKTRRSFLAGLAQSGLPVVCYHLPDGGIGKVEVKGDGFGFIGM